MNPQSLGATPAQVNTPQTLDHQTKKKPCAPTPAYLPSLYLPSPLHSYFPHLIPPVP